MKKETILITGGTGLVGSNLIPKLVDKGYDVRILSRSKKKSDKKNISYYTWNIKEQTIENGALVGVDYIIHLAGAGIADKKWTYERKKLIISSRVASLNLLYKEVEKITAKPKKIISASGIGYYGAVTKDKIFEESDASGTDFVADVCVKWEDGAKQFESLNISYFVPRIGVVLSDKGGALDRIKIPTKLNVGAPLGSGKQYMPWIHIDDLASVLMYAIENEQITGVYNAVGDEHVTNKVFSKKLAKVMGKAFFMPHVPAFMLKLVFGEMANIILEGSRVSNSQLKNEGFSFKYNTLEKALNNLFNKN